MARVKLNIKKSIFNDVYYPHLLDYSKRYNLFYGGAGSGKSVFVSQLLVIKAMTRQRKILVVRKFGTTLKDSVFQLIIDTLKKFQIYDDCKINLSTYTITLPNGSVFLFKNLDDPERIKSITDITDIWCEEATELNEDDFIQLDLRLRALVDDLNMFLTFNPTSKLNWVYRRWFAETAEVDYTTTKIVHTTYRDNKFLPQDYIQALEAKAKTDPNWYKVYTLGQFTTLDKLVFYNWKVEEFDHTQLKGELIVGLDFGFINDISALTAAILNEEAKTIHVFKTWGDTGKTNEELAAIITALGFSKSVIIADSAEQKSIVELKRAGIQRIRPALKGPDSVLHGIQKLQNYEIIIHPICKGLIDEMGSYSWQKDKLTGEYTNKPIDLNNHFCDSLRYSLQCIGNKLKTLSKDLF